MNDDDFLTLFRALDAPFAELRRRLAALEKQPARSEVAGAVEVVEALPAAGQPGRLLYQRGDGLYADNGAGWDGPLRGVGVVAARASRSASQSVPHDTTTRVNFDTVEMDTAGAITTGSAWAFTAPEAGQYLVTATVTVGSNSSWVVGEVARLELYRNDALYAWLAMNANINAYTPVTLNGATLVGLAAGETIDVRLYQNSGGTLSISGASGRTHVSIVKV